MERSTNTTESVYDGKLIAGAQNEELRLGLKAFAPKVDRTKSLGVSQPNVVNTN